MLTMLLLSLVFGFSVPAPGSHGGAGAQLPRLNVVQTATLGPSYSCRNSEALSGYGSSALFVADYSRELNAPDLLFNGACGSPDEFEASTAGDDMALIGDLGPGVEIEGLTAHRAFNLSNTATPASETKFSRTARVVNGHTYVVLLNKGRVRGLIVLTVTAHTANRSASLRYAVKAYSAIESATAAAGFGWEADSRTR